MIVWNHRNPAYVVMNVITGKAKDKKFSTLMYVLAVIFVLKYVLI